MAEIVHDWPESYDNEPCTRCGLRYSQAEDKRLCDPEDLPLTRSQRQFLASLVATEASS